LDCEISTDIVPYLEKARCVEYKLSQESRPNVMQSDAQKIERIAKEIAVSNFMWSLEDSIGYATGWSSREGNLMKWGKTHDYENYGS